MIHWNYRSDTRYFWTPLNTITIKQQRYATGTLLFLRHLQFTKVPLSKGDRLFFTELKKIFNAIYL